MSGLTRFPYRFPEKFPREFGREPVSGAPPFAERILDLFGAAVIGYWKLDEASGTAVIDSSPQMQTNGLYSGGVTLANALSPAGTLCPLFDGTNGKASAQSAGWAADFNGAEGSCAFFSKNVSHTNNEYILYFAVNSSNRVGFQQLGADGAFQWLYSAGGTADNKNILSVPAGFHQHIMTWSATDDKVRHYVDGVESGAALTGLGIFAGSIATSDIGGLTGVSFANVNIAHLYFLNRAMTPTEVATQ